MARLSPIPDEQPVMRTTVCSIRTKLKLVHSAGERKRQRNTGQRMTAGMLVIFLQEVRCFSQLLLCLLFSTMWEDVLGFFMITRSTWKQTFCVSHSHYLNSHTGALRLRALRHTKIAPPPPPGNTFWTISLFPKLFPCQNFYINTSPKKYTEIYTYMNVQKHVIRSTKQL